VSADFYHRGNIENLAAYTAPLPNSRCGPASHYFWGYEKKLAKITEKN